MNPNQLNREIRNLEGNFRSRRLPGGSLVSAVLDRRLMTWSDRGGASRLFGEIWSEYTWQLLTNGSRLGPLGNNDQETLHVVRLDANPRIAIQASRNKLSNPDFLIVSGDPERSVVVRAIDAKFAVDRLRRSQISAQATQDLIELPGSLARTQIEREIGEGKRLSPTYGPGVFLAPRSLLNDYYYQKLTSGQDPEIPPEELELVQVDADSLFQGSEVYDLMMFMRRVDAIPPVNNVDELLLGMYYLRLACAARWIETQARTPLLSISAPEPVAAAEARESAERRLVDGRTAFNLVADWSRLAERSLERQKQVQDAAMLPLRMAEIREIGQRAGIGEDKKQLRKLRGSLECLFRHSLVEEIGEIPAQPKESFDSILKRVASARKKLRQEIRAQATSIASDLSEQSSAEDERTPESE